MRSIYLVKHLHIFPDGEEDVKMIGVYKSCEDALKAVARLELQPGFCDHPKVVDGDMSGFEIEEYKIGEDHWKEGYVIV